MKFSALLHSVTHLLFPQRCCICERRLQKGEEHLCIVCLHALPRTGWHGFLGNRLERLFWAKIPIVRANAYLKYKAHTRSKYLFFHFKYYDRPAVAIHFGQIMATDVEEGFFAGVDAIIPIPLAKKRLRQRGYNQSEMLARGIAKETGLPVWADCIERTVETGTQTRLTKAERAANVANVFKTRNAEKLKGKHILLVDDVITSGATTLSCAREIALIEGVRISIMSLGIAGKHTMARGIEKITSIKE